MSTFEHLQSTNRVLNQRRNLPHCHRCDLTESSKEEHWRWSATLRAQLAVKHWAPVGDLEMTCPATKRSDMAELVNLRTARKRAQRHTDEMSAHANRLAHGRSKTAKQLEAARDAKASRDLESHRIETGGDR